MQDSLFGTDRVDALMHALQALTWTVDGQTVRWPADDRKDRPLAASLIEQSGEADIIAKLAKWPTWVLAHQDQLKGRGVNPRARIRTWICYGTRYPAGNARSRQRSNGAGRPAGPGTPAGGAPAGPDAWRGKSGIASF